MIKLECRYQEKPVGYNGKILIREVAYIECLLQKYAEMLMCTTSTWVGINFLSLQNSGTKTGRKAAACSSAHASELKSHSWNARVSVLMFSLSLSLLGAEEI